MTNCSGKVVPALMVKSLEIVSQQFGGFPELGRLLPPECRQILASVSGLSLVCRRHSAQQAAAGCYQAGPV